MGHYAFLTLWDEGALLWFTSLHRSAYRRRAISRAARLGCDLERGAIVLIAGYILVGRHRRLLLDEILAGVALVVWTIVDRVNDTMFGGANPEMVKIWTVRGGLLLVLILVYGFARSRWHVEQQEV